MSINEAEKMKQYARKTWSTGDFAAVALREVWPIGERIVQQIAVRPGEDVLDVACGTGNAAIRAALAGGHVVGVDLTPELFEAGRRLASESGVEVQWVEGDAENLPVEDNSFDVALSVMGCMFAPRHEITARELVRVLRPGGRLGICSWTHDGVMSKIFRTMGRYLPPPPAFASPPTMWGSEDHVHALFEGTGIDLTFQREQIEFPPFDSPEDNVEFHLATFGPFIMARELAEREGRWTELREELISLHTGLTSAEYLVVLGRKQPLASE